MAYDTVITGGTIATEAGPVRADVAVSEERIAATGTGLGPAREVIDASGLIVTPGGVDPHCHIEQMSGMGLMNADTFETATASAAIGGTTTVISFAAQQRGEPPEDTVATYAARAARGARVDHAFHFSVADTTAPDFAGGVARIASAGHRSVKAFTTYNVKLEDAEILALMDVTRDAGQLLCVHAETDAIIARERSRLLAAGRTRPLDHAASRPVGAEVDAVARICRFARLTGAPTMIFHVTAAAVVDVIREARAAGAPVWAETCTHYLFQTEEVLDRPGIEGAKWMCSPPQRSEADREALWAALEEGVLSLVSSDHAPYRMDESGKLSAGAGAPFPKIANGQPGLEVRLPLLFDAMVSRGRGGLARFVELTAGAPARIYGLEHKGRIAPGADADLVLWDPGRSHTYGAADLHDNVGYNPFEGTRVTGWPVRTLLRGRTIVEDGALSAPPGGGQWLSRPEFGTVPL
ncbi:MAG: dihydropyrimidinase [Pseudomonadota bacterium]